MRLHQRYSRVAKAQSRIQFEVLKTLESQEPGEARLTTVEIIKLLSEVQMTVANWALREERHPAQPGMKADEYCENPLCRYLPRRQDFSTRRWRMIEVPGRRF